MSSLEERVTDVERRMETNLGDLRKHMDQRLEQVDHRFAWIDRRFDQIDRRFDQVDRRFEHIDRRFDLMENRFLALEQKIDRHFTWLVGIQMTSLIAIIATVVGSLYIQRGG